MKTKAKLFSICLGMCSALSLNAHSATIFEDSFETGDMSASNAEGFSWGNNNRTSVVTETADTPWCTISGPTAVYNNKEICNGPKVPAGGGDYIAKDGDFSLRFIYPAGDHVWAEQRFDLGSAKTELWMRFWLKVPENYEHRNLSPNNKKLFALWMDGYSTGHAGNVVGALWHDGAGGTNVKIDWTSETTDLVGGVNSYGEKQHTDLVPFISYPADQGRWMQIVVHVKEASGPSVPDGVIQFWRRWDGEAFFTKLGESLNTRIYHTGSVAGWKPGYLLGFDNSGFAENTEWLVDSFTIADEPLINLGPSPKAPILTVVQ